MGFRSLQAHNDVRHMLAVHMAHTNNLLYQTQLSYECVFVFAVGAKYVCVDWNISFDDWIIICLYLFINLISKILHRIAPTVEHSINWIIKLLFVYRKWCKFCGKIFRFCMHMRLCKANIFTFLQISKALDEIE